MTSRTILVLACVLACVLAGQDSKPSAPETQSRPKGWNLQLAETARARIVELKQTGKGKITVKRGDIDVSLPVDWSLQARWLDEISAVNKESMEDRRTFIEARKTEAGQTQDPGFDGITFVMTTRGDKTTVESAPPRRPLKKSLAKQLAQAGATGLWVGLPEAAEIGASFPFDGKPLIATLVDHDGEISDWKGTLTLDSVDPKTNRAYLSGNVRFSESVDNDGLKWTGSYSAALALDVDLAVHEIMKVTLKGLVTVAGGDESKGSSVTGEVAFDGEATAKPATDVAAIKARKPVFRENQHRFAGADFRLPSCWLLLNPGSTPANFLDSRLEDDLVIEVTHIEQQVDPQDPNFIAGLLNSIRKADPDAKATKATFPIGKGLSFEFHRADGKYARGCVAQFGKNLLRVAMVGPEAAVKKADAELRALVNSVKKAVP